MTALVNPGLADELARSDGFDADACMNCGVCSAICPICLLYTSPSPRDS